MPQPRSQNLLELLLLTSVAADTNSPLMLLEAVLFVESEFRVIER